MVLNTQISPTPLQIILFLTSFYIIFTLILYVLRDKKIFAKKIKEHVWPIKFYILGMIIAVYIQYLAMSLQQSGRIGQLLWQLMIVLSVITLVKKYKFNLKNIAFLGILYVLLIHGAKCSLRYFVYGIYNPIPYKTLEYIGSRFIYGSFLAIALAVGVFFAISLLEEINKKQKDKKKIAKLVFWLLLIVVFILLSSTVYKEVTFS